MNQFQITDDPEYVVAQLNGLVDPSATGPGHKHDGTAGNGPKILGANISGAVASANNATNANHAANVTTNINGHSITSIFEANGITVKNATNATNAQTAGTAINGVPVGAVFHFAASTAPAGYLKCDGSAVPRALYSALFAVIGTSFGAGDGSTTFHLPNLIDRMAVGCGGSYWLGQTGGESTHTLSYNEMPAHNHSFNLLDHGRGGLGYSSAGWDTPSSYSTGYAGGNLPHNNMPPYIALLPCIKY